LAWTIEIIRSARKDLAHVDRQWQRRILGFLESDLSQMSNPRDKGKPLSGDLAHFWCYRVGDYRIVCDIRDHIEVIRVVRVGHRSRVYD